MRRQTEPPTGWVIITALCFLVLGAFIMISFLGFFM